VAVTGDHARGGYFLAATAITSISTRNPGFARAATPITERAGKFG
jgi:hypothetical protein